MCVISGIVSYRKLNKIRALEIAKHLLVDNKSSGDATGFALINTDNQRSVIMKEGIDAEKFFETKGEEIAKLFMDTDYNVVLLHNRLKTHGEAKDNKNNHPFMINDNVLIHNGIISNYKELVEKYKLKDKLVSECDSEIILQIFNKTKSVNSISNQLTGTFNYALYDSKENNLHIYKDTMNLYLAYIPEEDIFVFCSDEDTIKNLFSEVKTYFGLFKQEIKADETKVAFCDDFDTEHDFIFKFNEKKMHLKPIKKKFKYVTAWDYADAYGYPAEKSELNAKVIDTGFKKADKFGQTDGEKKSIEAIKRLLNIRKKPIPDMTDEEWENYEEGLESLTQEEWEDMETQAENELYGYNNGYDNEMEEEKRAEERFIRDYRI